MTFKEISKPVTVTSILIICGCLVSTPNARVFPIDYSYYDYDEEPSIGGGAVGVRSNVSYVTKSATNVTESSLNDENRTVILVEPISNEDLNSSAVLETEFSTEVGVTEEDQLWPDRDSLNEKNGTEDENEGLLWPNLNEIDTDYYSDYDVIERDPEEVECETKLDASTEIRQEIRRTKVSTKTRLSTFSRYPLPFPTSLLN